MGRRLGEHERTVPGFFIVFRIGGVKVDARASFKRSKESRRHADPNPTGDPIQLFTGHEIAIVVISICGGGGGGGGAVHL